MSEDVKKNLRTQGKYDIPLKNREKRTKESPIDKEPPGKKSHPQKRKSDGSKEQNIPFNEDTAAISVQYEENASHSFEELEDVKKPTEIKKEGLHTLSDTANGVSTILFEPNFIEPDEACDYYDELCECIPWSEKNIVIRDVEYPQPRLVAWYGPFPYSYSGVILEPQEIPDNILRIKRKVEAYLKEHNINVTLNSVLLNCYRNEKDSVAWHSDDELTMGVCPTIASVSLGEARKFEMKRKVKSYDTEISPDQVDQYFVHLTHGSLLIMNGSMQTDWQHRIPKEYHNKFRRINLTFRTVYALEKIPCEIPTKGYSEHFAKNNETSKPPINIINDEDFPPLGSTVHSFSSGTDDSLQEKFEGSNSSFKTNEDDKSMDCYDDDSQTNNLNDEKTLIKPHVILNKNVHTNNSFAGDSDAMNADESWDRNDSYNGSSCTNEGHMDESMESIVSNVHKYSCVEDDIQPPFSPPSSSSHLNVEAKEFVPSISPIATSEDVLLYSKDSLECLLEIDIESLEDTVYLEYASALKERIMERIQDFRFSERDELAFLGNLMDNGDLTVKGQKLVTKRMIIVVNKTSRSPYTSNFRRNSKPCDGYTRQSHHADEDYYNSKKSYSSQNRGSSSRGNTRRDGQYFNREKRNFGNRSDYNREEYSNTERGDSVQEGEYDGREKVYSHRGRVNSNRGNRYRREEKYSNTEKGDPIQENEYDRERYSNRDRISSRRGRGFNHRKEQSSNTEGGNSSQDNEYNRREKYSDKERGNSSQDNEYSPREKYSDKERENSSQDNEYDRREKYSDKERENSSHEKGYNHRDEGHPDRKRGNPSQRKGYSESRRGAQTSRGRGSSHD